PPAHRRGPLSRAGRSRCGPLRRAGRRHDRGTPAAARRSRLPGRLAAGAVGDDHTGRRRGRASARGQAPTSQEAVVDVEAPARDDRVRPLTRGVAYGIVPFLVVAFAVLYPWPDDTGRLFAWPIRPTMTAM